MAAAARLIQTVRPHVPRIHFPNRQLPQSGSVSDVSAQVPVVPVSAASITNPATAAGSIILPSYAGKIGETARGSGIEFRDLPARYHRRPLDQAEIEYIERGGPE